MKNDYKSVRNRVKSRIGALNTRYVEDDCGENGVRSLACILDASEFTVKETQDIAFHIADAFIWSWEHESHHPEVIDVAPMIKDSSNVYGSLGIGGYMFSISSPPYVDLERGLVKDDYDSITRVIDALPGASSLIMNTANPDLMRSDINISEMLESLPKGTITMYDIIIRDINATCLIESYQYDSRDMASLVPVVDDNLRLAQIATLLYSSPKAMLIDCIINNINYYNDSKRSLPSWYHQVIKDDSWSDSWYDVLNAMFFGTIMYLKKVKNHSNEEFESLMRTRFWNDRFWNIENVRSLASLPYTVVMENARMGDYL